MRSHRHSLDHVEANSPTETSSGCRIGKIGWRLGFLDDQDLRRRGEALVKGDMKTICWVVEGGLRPALDLGSLNVND